MRVCLCIFCPPFLPSSLLPLQFSLSFSFTSSTLPSPCPSPSSPGTTLAVRVLVCSVSHRAQVLPCEELHAKIVIAISSGDTTRCSTKFASHAVLFEKDWNPFPHVVYSSRKMSTPFHYKVCYTRNPTPSPHVVYFPRTLNVFPNSIFYEKDFKRFPTWYIFREGPAPNFREERSRVSVFFSIFLSRRTVGSSEEITRLSFGWRCPEVRTGR